MTFDQTNGGTTVLVRLNPNPVGPLKLLSPAFARIGQKVMQRLIEVDRTTVGCIEPIGRRGDYQTVPNFRYGLLVS